MKTIIKLIIEGTVEPVEAHGGESFVRVDEGEPRRLEDIMALVRGAVWAGEGGTFRIEVTTEKVLK